MTKSVCCLILALGVVACAPRKAVIVEEPPAGPTRRQATKPTTGPAPAEDTAPQPAGQGSGMRIPDPTRRLPDQRDMTATATPAAGGGVTATPPTAEKRGSE
jgi:hypothetical protein